MNPTPSVTSSPAAVVALRWIARIASLASIGLLALFAFGGLENGVPTALQTVSLLLFPVGVVAGMVWAWWNELRGGILTAVSLVAFYAWMAIAFGRMSLGPYFVLLASPGLGLLVCGLIEQQRRRLA